MERDSVMPKKGNAAKPRGSCPVRPARMLTHRPCLPPPPLHTRCIPCGVWDAFAYRRPRRAATRHRHRP